MIRNYFNTVKLIVISVFLAMFATVSANASVNTVDGIEISQNQNGNYNVLLKTEKSSSVKAIRNIDNKLILVLKSTLPNESVEISYNNAPELNNVIVQKKNADNTVIVLEGNSIQNASINELQLSNGTLKQNIGNSGILADSALVNDKKLMSSSFLSLFMAIILFVSLRQKKNKVDEAKDSAEKLKKAIKNANTLRKKNKLQSKNIPSINYNVRNYATAPKGFVINKYQGDEEVRKVG